MWRDQKKKKTYPQILMDHWTEAVFLGSCQSAMMELNTVFYLSLLLLHPSLQSSLVAFGKEVLYVCIEFIICVYINILLHFL